MANVYEQNLPQKSNLTTSDFIRVVGSDNVSYKQEIPSVMNTMGVARTLISNNSDFNSLGYVASLGSAYYRGSNISTMTNRPSAEVNAFPWALDVINIDGYVKQILHVYSASGTIKVYERQQYYSSGSRLFASWEAMPTRAEVDSLNSKTNLYTLAKGAGNSTTMTLTLSDASSGYSVFFTGRVGNNSATGAVYGVIVLGNDNEVFIQHSSSLTIGVSRTGNVITLTLPSTYSLFYFISYYAMS